MTVRTTLRFSALIALGLSVSCSTQAPERTTIVAKKKSAVKNPASENAEGEKDPDTDDPIDDNGTDPDQPDSEPSPNPVPPDEMEPTPPVEPAPEMPPVVVDPEPRLSLLFVGGYGSAIDVYKFNRSTGETQLLKSNAAPGVNPGFLAIDAKRKRVFAANERESGGVRSYTLNPESGELQFVNEGPIQGGPTAVSVTADGKYVFGASYGSGRVTSYSVGSDGRLTTVSDLYAGRKAHHILPDTKGGSVYVPCLGSNYIAQYTLGANGSLTPMNPATLSVGSGGPRHIAFHGTQNLLYVVNELNSTVQALSIGNSGALSLKGQQVSSLNANVPNNTGAEIAVHPNGKFVYSSNRGQDSIATFSLAADGSLTLKGTTPSGGQKPRHFSVDAKGKWLFAGNQESGVVAVFKINPDTGAIQATGQQLRYNQPTFVQLVDFE